MAVKIRLARIGGHNKPFYRVVVANSEAKRDGKFIEVVGTYNPMLSENKYSLKGERVKYWLSQGAKPTETVKSIFKNELINKQ